MSIEQITLELKELEEKKDLLICDILLDMDSEVITQIIKEVRK